MSARSNDTAKSCPDLLPVLKLEMSASGTQRTVQLTVRSAMRYLFFSIWLVQQSDWDESMNELLEHIKLSRITTLS